MQGQASDIQVIESSIDLNIPLDVTALTEVYKRRRAPTDPAGPLPEPEDDGLAACGTGHIDIVALDDRILFQEAPDETGCGEGRFRLPVPIGARNLVVRFDATREISSLASQADVQRPLAVQDLLFVADPDDVQVTFSYFEPDERSYRDPQQRVHSYALQDHPQEDVLVAWYFADDGASADPSLFAPTGHAYSASIHRPQVTWSGVPMPLAGPAERSESIVGTDIETRFRLGTRVHVADFLNVTSEGGPYLLDQATFSFTIKVAEHNRLVRLVGPDGADIDSSGLELRRAAGVLEIRITDAATTAHGEGLYTLVLTTTAPVQGSDTFKPFAVLLLLLPLPVGVMAWRAARNFERRVGNAFATTTLMLKAGVLTASVYYAIVLVLGLRTERIELMSSWPLPAAGGLLYGLLLLAFVAFVALWLFGDRYLTDAMSRSIAEHERMGRELKERSGELESFVYAVSHDLKTPLVSLEWLVHSLEEALGDTKGHKGRERDLRRILERIHANIDGMDTLISDLLELSRVGRVEGAAAPVDLAETVRKVVDDVEAQRNEHGARIDVDTATLPRVLADRTRLEQVLRNLIVNALKYGRMRDGHVRVRAWREAREPGADVLHIEVDDNGPGVPEEFREQIFLLFQRAPDPYGRPIQGTGVGLALARKIARSYGGDLTAGTSDLGGARFDLVLPASRVVPGADTAPRGQRDRSPSPSTDRRPTGAARPV